MRRDHGGLGSWWRSLLPRRWPLGGRIGHQSPRRARLRHAPWCPVCPGHRSSTSCSWPRRTGLRPLLRRVPRPDRRARPVPNGPLLACRRRGRHVHHAGRTGPDAAGRRPLERDVEGRVPRWRDGRLLPRGRSHRRVDRQGHRRHPDEGRGHPQLLGLANKYGIGDKMFASWRGASFANNVFAVAAQTGRFDTTLGRRAILSNPSGGDSGPGLRPGAATTPQGPGCG